MKHSIILLLVCIWVIDFTCKAMLLDPASNSDIEEVTLDMKYLALDNVTRFQLLLREFRATHVSVTLELTEQCINLVEVSLQERNLQLYNRSCSLAFAALTAHVQSLKHHTINPLFFYQCSALKSLTQSSPLKIASINHLMAQTHKVNEPSQRVVRRKVA